MKLASEMGRMQADSVFVFDEPTIGLHPLDVQVLLGVFQALIDRGATVVVIEHDLDVIRNADYIIDMGPGAVRRVAGLSLPERSKRFDRHRKAGQDGICNCTAWYGTNVRPDTEYTSP